ncbi:MAG: cysteine hydrolase [Clostridiales bacterium]|nr:cysteine hydrolase [Clostridiales bacterium]
MSRLLIVVDMQKDFIDGALGFEGADRIIPGIAEKISEYEKSGDEIVYTLDTHHEDYMNTQEGRNLPVPHCIEGTDGYLVCDGLRDLLDGKKVFKKPTFGSLELGNYINGKDYSEIEVCGLVSNICVVSNAVIAKAAAAEAEIIVDRNLTASFDPKLGEEVFDILSGIQVTVR